MSKKWYTADWHLFHTRLMVKYCDRPFKSLDEMHAALVYGVNSVVAKNDELYILGDVCLDTCKPRRAVCSDLSVFDIIKRMNGRKHLIVGNHDPSNLVKSRIWETVSQYKEIKDNGQRVVLFHYPILSWNKRAKGSVHLHGHCHGTLRNVSGDDHHSEVGFRCDVGVDCWDFKPVSLDDVFKKFFQNGRIV